MQYCDMYHYYIYNYKHFLFFKFTFCRKTQKLFDNKGRKTVSIKLKQCVSKKGPSNRGPTKIRSDEIKSGKVVLPLPSTLQTAMLLFFHALFPTTFLSSLPYLSTSTPLSFLYTSTPSMLYHWTHPPSQHFSTPSTAALQLSVLTTHLLPSPLFCSYPILSPSQPSTLAPLSSPIASQLHGLASYSLNRLLSSSFLPSISLSIYCSPSPPLLISVTRSFSSGSMLTLSPHFPLYLYFLPSLLTSIIHNTMTH